MEALGAHTPGVWSAKVAKKSFRCKLVTPTAALVNDQVSYVSLPAWDGLMGVMPDRAPMLVKLGLGELRLDFADSDKGQGGSRSFLVDGGLVEMANNQMTILAERAIPGEAIIASEAEAEFRAAQAAGATATGAGRAKAQKDLDRARLKLQLSGRSSSI